MEKNFTWRLLRGPLGKSAINPERAWLDQPGEESRRKKKENKMNAIFVTLLAIGKFMLDTIWYGIIAVFLVVIYTVTGRFTAPMTIPEAQRETPGISFVQLWSDREALYQIKDEKVNHPAFVKQMAAYNAKLDKRIMKSQFHEVGRFLDYFIFGAPPHEASCVFFHKMGLLWPIFGTPQVGYAAIHREMIKQLPYSARDAVAPNGMFPSPDQATLEDYIESSWYSFQSFYWWIEVNHQADSCRTARPSQTLKEQIKGAKKK